MYRAAASARFGDAQITETNVAGLTRAFPDVDPIACTGSMPCERDADRLAIPGALGTIDWDT